MKMIGQRSGILLAVSVALIAAISSTPVSAQFTEASCDWSRVDGTNLRPEEGDLTISKKPRFEHGTRGTVDCQLVVEKEDPLTTLVLSTQLTEPRWTVGTSEGKTIYRESSVEIPIGNLDFVIDGTAPVTIHDDEDKLGHKHETVIPESFDFLKIEFRSGQHTKSFREFGAISAHPETVKVEERIVELRENAPERRLRVIKLAEEVLLSGFPVQANNVLESAAIMKGMEPKLWERFLPAMLLVAGLVFGGLIGFIAGRANKKGNVDDLLSLDDPLSP
jgi:hypothetical protein